MTIRPAPSVSPATLAPIWSAADADALAVLLDQVYATCASTRGSLRRTALRTTTDWRGPSRIDFDRRQAHLVGVLIDLEHLSATLARLIRARTAEVGSTDQTSVPPFAGTRLVPGLITGGR